MTVTVNNPSIKNVVNLLCLRAGLTADQFDVSALASITRPLQGMAISQLTSTRQPLELLMSVYFFEMTVSDKIYFRPRGAAPVATIPYLDLGASLGSEAGEPLPMKQRNELEIAAQVAVSYINVTDDYQADTQYSDRLISAAEGTTMGLQLAIGMTPSEAKLVADAVLQDQSVSRLSTTIALLGDYCALEPTDPVLVTDESGDTLRIRLVQKRDSYPVLSFDAVLEDISVLTSPAVTSDDYHPPFEIAAPPGTVMELMDIPILSDADNDSGFYVATKGDSDVAYVGAAILDSPDNIVYTREGTTTEAAVMGTCTTVLGSWSGPRVFDEVNTVTVDVGAGELNSTTRNAVLSNAATNAVVVGSELLQFRTATLLGPGLYKLSGLLRGARGTEWAMGAHATDERFVLLNAGGVTRIPVDNSVLGVPRYYKGVTLGQPLSSATAQVFTDNAVGLKPFSPFDARGERDPITGDLTITWQRRTRLAVRVLGSLGINIPLGEAAESYRVNIFVGSPMAVVRTLTSSTPSVVYTAAEQLADGFTLGEPIPLTLYQISAAVNRGYPLEAIV